MSKNLLIIVIPVLAAIIGAVFIGSLMFAPPAEDVSRSNQAGLANPASAYCVEIGGVLEIIERVGGQVGMCHLPDGRVCEEWALFQDGACEA